MNIAIILAGGTGTRLGGDMPKQYIEVNGKPIIGYSIEVLDRHPQIDVIWIVADEVWRDYIKKSVCMKKVRGFSLPGANRQLSVWNALCDVRFLAEPDTRVFIHDAARPVLTAGMVTEYLAKAKEHDGVLPVLPMKDTVYLSADGTTITALLDRSRVVAGQAPEVFHYEKYYRANERLLPDEIMKINGSSEPAVLAGMEIAVVFGEEQNFKITTQADLERFRQLVEKDK